MRPESQQYYYILYQGNIYRDLLPIKRLENLKENFLASQVFVDLNDLLARLKIINLFLSDQPIVWLAQL